MCRPGALPTSPRLSIECQLHDYAFVQPLATRQKWTFAETDRDGRSLFDEAHPAIETGLHEVPVEA